MELEKKMLSKKKRAKKDFNTHRHKAEEHIHKTLFERCGQKITFIIYYISSLKMALTPLFTMESITRLELVYHFGDC